jgi:succinate dehydrogenase / fumarate reductase cytochrome b subunit
MANIFTSSIGKKLIMSITGLFLILFLLIHLVANSAYLLGEEAFDAVIEFMGSPVILVMVPVLAAGFIIHILYASLLTLYNLKARGSQRYAVSNKGATDSWASKNMYVLGIIIAGVLIFHLTHFWAKMQLAEFTGGDAQNGNELMHLTFGNTWIVICYLIWFAALWFHLTHGFWSAFHSIGANNQKWINRLRVISYIYATLIFAGFATIAITAWIRA